MPSLARSTLRLLAATGFASSLAAGTPVGAGGAYPWADLAISSSANERYLYRTQSEAPFLWVADTNWELFKRMNHTDADLYLADRSAKGFNVVQAVIISHYDATNSTNFFGDVVVENSDPTRPVEGYFEFVDWVVSRAAAEYGILVCILPTWSRYVNNGWYGGAGEKIFDEASAQWFGRFLGRRYPGLPKMLGGDTNAFWADNVPEARAAWRKNPSSDPKSHLGPVTDSRPLWAAMMKGLKEGEREHGCDAFVTYQPTSPWISDPPTPLPYGHNYINGTYGTLSMDAVQSGHESPDPDGVDAGFTVLTPWDSNRNYDNILQMRREFPGPVMDVENHYEGAHDAFDPAKPLWNASHVRHGFYPALFSGACGVTYGSLPVQQTYERPELVATGGPPPGGHYHPPYLGLDAEASWHEGIHLPGALQTGHVLKVFEPLATRAAFGQLEPARQYVRGTEGQQEGRDIMQFEGTRYVAAMIAKDRFWVYTGFGDAFWVDLGAISAAFITLAKIAHGALPGGAQGNRAFLVKFRLYVGTDE